MVQKKEEVPNTNLHSLTPKSQHPTTNLSHGSKKITPE